MLKWLDALDSEPAGRGDEAAPAAPAPAEAEQPAPGNGDALPDLLEAVRHLVDPDELAELRKEFDTNPDAVTALCHWLLAAPPLPNPEQVEDLGRLIVRLATLENWPHDKLMVCLDWWRCMAPVRVVDELNRFKERIAAAEASQAGQ